MLIKELRCGLMNSGITLKAKEINGTYGVFKLFVISVFYEILDILSNEFIIAEKRFS